MCLAITSARSLRSTPRTERPKRLHRQPAGLQVQIDVAAVAPAIDEHLRRVGHVAAEGADVLLGEHRLQCALAWAPLLIGQDEEAVPRRVPGPLRGRCTAPSRRHCGPARRESRWATSPQRWAAPAIAGRYCTRVIGPPESRTTSCTVSSTRAYLSTVQMGSGFFGTRGSALTSVGMRLVNLVPVGEGTPRWRADSVSLRPIGVTQQQRHQQRGASSRPVRARCPNPLRRRRTSGCRHRRPSR